MHGPNVDVDSVDSSIGGRDAEKGCPVSLPFARVVKLKQSLR